jgi:hypothetical protein
MKAFKLEVVRERRMQVMIALAKSEDAAKDHVLARRTGWHVVECVELAAPSYLTVSEWELDNDGERMIQHLPTSVRIAE